ncbi:MAG TPA: type I-D CRISPR-associated protein Cas10d/Csc3 [Ktedonobacteraceae bacterium]|nr:type I-D CRISPR-associated protein Cas10d/Csc3 [Ktedonobacteraceae bacterium]
MFYLEFLKRGVEPGDTVTRSFIDQMLLHMMEAYAEKSAKGGEHHDETEQRRENFEKNVDQSMVSHLLNGIFPTMRLLNWLEMLQLGPEPFSEVEKQIYILSYLMHDVDKIEKLHGLETASREDIDKAKGIIEKQLLACKAENFFPDFAAYLEDITYLVVNTQQKYGTHLHTYLWQLRLKERRLLLLRRLCTYSDQIAYLVSTPSAILLGNETLSTILAELSDDQLVFTYHQLREVRGLLTNVINNGLVELFKSGRTGELWPYLFFSDGVVYIKRKSSQFTLASEQIVDAVQDRLRALCATTIKENAPGFKFSIQGMVKHPDYYFEFLSLEEYFELLANNTLSRTNNDVVRGPFEKLRQMQARGEIPADLALNTFTEDGERRIGKVSRFLSAVFVTILGMLDKQHEALRVQTEQAVIKHLGLTPYWEQSLAIPNRGGVEYRWFWLGGCYLHDNQGLKIYREERSLEATFLSTIQLILSLAGEELRKQLPQKYLSHLTHYLDSVVELPPSVRPQGQWPDFQGELERYAGAKGKGRRAALVCTLCNSAYPTEEQSDSTALFQPWVYKNKLSLYAGKNAGGVCTICSLELMLRQIMLQGQLRLTGGKFEALKTKYIAVYPNFFFTAETGELVKGILDQLETINFFIIRRQLNRQEIKVSTLLKLEAFGAQDAGIQPFIYQEEDESTDDDAEQDSNKSEEGDTEQAEKKADDPAQRSYIKYVQETYPGMCFFGMKAGKETDDTSTWAMPAFLALALPLVTNTKVVISEMSLPLFSSGHEFRETVVFDAPHPYLGRLLKTERVRVNRLLSRLRVLTSIYTVNLDTYAKKGKPEWKHLSEIARDLETDPLFLFSYLRKQERNESMYPGSVEHYMHIYKEIDPQEETLSRIKACVDAYTAFYRGGYNSHSILKPVDIVAKAIITSPLDIDKEDLLWQIQGEIKNWLDRVRSDQAKGWAIFYGKDIDTQQAEAVRNFVEIFYNDVFLDYCQKERGLLRNRINRFKDGCEAYYVYKRSHKDIEEHEENEENALSV